MTLVLNTSDWETMSPRNLESTPYQDLQGLTLNMIGKDYIRPN